MPDWFLAVVGWMVLMLGCLGLWHGVMLWSGGNTRARDSTGTPARLVVVESSGLVLLGTALLLERWIVLGLPAVVLMTVAEVSRLRRRCSTVPDHAGGGSLL
ncbi:hypothetical protein ACWKSP_13910 [Micromonosporaceae bacterium Da 78-11]